MDRRPIGALTGVRFFAAFHVVWYHYAPRLTGWGGNVAENGYMAVALFFVLSGFVLAYNYEGRRTSARNFWRARFARIYPAYLLAFVLAAPAVAVRLWHADPARLAASGLAAGTLLQGWYPPLALVWNGPGWSLSNEAFFYLLFPVLLPAMARLGNRRLGQVAAGCAAAAPVPMLVALGVSGVAASNATTFVPLFRLAEFALGVAAGLFFVRGVRGGRWLPASVAALLAFAVFSPLWVPTSLRPGLAAPLFAFFVFTLASREGAGVRWLGGKVLYELGDASYAVYILQSPLMGYFLLATQGMRAEGAARAPLSWTQFWLYAALLIGVSLACYRWVETPARRWLMRNSGGRAVRGAQGMGSGMWGMGAVLVSPETSQSSK